MCSYCMGVLLYLAITYHDETMPVPQYTHQPHGKTTIDGTTNLLKSKLALHICSMFDKKLHNSLVALAGRSMQWGILYKLE